jgi:hypothetical protein
MEAGRAHSTRIERIPSVAAATNPLVILARRPSVERASDARAGGNRKSRRNLRKPLEHNGEEVVKNDQRGTLALHIRACW